MYPVVIFLYPFFSAQKRYQTRNEGDSLKDMGVRVTIVVARPGVAGGDSKSTPKPSTSEMIRSRSGSQALPTDMIIIHMIDG